MPSNPPLAEMYKATGTILRRDVYGLFHAISLRLNCDDNMPGFQFLDMPL
jgi:hypothetical protein